jgi:hypothetical protein
MLDDSHALPMESIAGERVLGELGAELGGSRIDLEFSLRLRPGSVCSSGRFGCWLAGDHDSDFAPLAPALRRLGAPEPVVSAQQRAECPVRQGIAVAPSPDGPEFRLYLHGRDAVTRHDHYAAWRWRIDGSTRRSRYTFHFLPETAGGAQPLDLVDHAWRPALAQMLAHERVQQLSGFWLRHGPNGALEQLDLIFPWHPAAGDIPGIADLGQLLSVPPDHPSGWATLPVRHVAFPIGRADAVTLYASAPGCAWPADEAELQRQVRSASAQLSRDIEQRIFAGLPPRSGATANERLDRFYGGDIATWQRILGPEMHYHAGLFETPATDDAAMTAALRRAVTELYPFIAPANRIYDIGCGWGGPLAMLTRDLGCAALGLTISRTQFRHVAGLGLPVRWGDAEITLPPGRFDCVLMLESFCHIRDKARLLAVLRAFTPRLVMRVNCQDGAPEGPAFGDTMQMVSSARLRELLLAAGWQIRHWRDRRPEALPSVHVWSRRLAAVPQGDEHIETLREWCARVLADPEAWGSHNPLIEVVCD